MERFFAERDDLTDAYRTRSLSEVAWAAEVGALLGRIDALLPAYARVATPEQVALATKLRADLEGGVARGTVPDHQEAALDAAILEKALADAIGT